MQIIYKKIVRHLPVVVFILLIVQPTTAAAEPPDTGSFASSAAEDSQQSDDRGILGRLGRGFSMHKKNYILPLTWGNRARDAEDAEVKFQLSFKQHFGRDLFLAYTQKSFWRILDSEDSRPFRETNHNPQIFYRLPPRSVSWGRWGADLGFEHESNGDREPTSRSWNRLYIIPFVEYGRLRAELKLWHRISEEVKEDPLDPSGDENPDIEDFYGYGELRLSCETLPRHRASLMVRWNFATDKGGMRLDYSIPTRIEDLFIYTHLWSGYGESLIDYNRSLTRYGIGLQFR